MKILITIISLFVYLTSFGQVRTFSGIVLDSLTTEPIAFAHIASNQKSTATTDFNGKFILNIDIDSAFTLKVTADGYKSISFTTNFNSTFLTIKLISIPLNSQLDSMIWGKIIDTSFYKNGNIKSIKKFGRNEIGYYKSGQKKYQLINDEYREWYINGNLKLHSVIKFNHEQSVTKWHDNGVMKEYGTMYWGHNKKRKTGSWIKNNDWKYWDKGGKEIKK